MLEAEEVTSLMQQLDAAVKRAAELELDIVVYLLEMARMNLHEEMAATAAA